MEHPKKDIGTVFKSHWEQMDITPSEALWHKIEPELPRKKKSNRIFFWWFFVMVNLGGVLFYFGEKNTAHNSIQHNSTPKKVENNSKHKNANYNSHENSFSLIHKVSGKGKQEKIETNKTTSSYFNKKRKEPLKKFDSESSSEINNFTPSWIVNSEQTFEHNEQTSDNTNVDDFNSVALACDTLQKIVKRQKKTQEKDTSKTKEKAVFWVGSFSKIYLSDFNSNASMFINSGATSENKKLNYGYGLLLKWQWNSDWSVQMGLGILNQQEQLEIQNAPNIFNTQNVALNRSSQEMNDLLVNETSFDMIHTTRYLEIPVEFSKQWPLKRITLNATAGISNWILLNNEITVQSSRLSKQYIGKLDAQNKFTTSLNLRAGLHFKIWKQFTGGIEPGLQIQILPTKAKDSRLYYHYLIQTGLYYKL
ncbi:hypothetical protein [Flavobacterium stagni]|uniref:Outer membrane protein beta-barrel domain-containing protein n=1 Tax=Flavobacterium stagni TaxID=2506421 RepID=A0A4Q1KCG6_9FLAO|nr:hypothetical protein [Flavobacterium stagni]RXR23913.1 hypothetical protein EQG61_00290 [Flavobacterium stagni]